MLLWRPLVVEPGLIWNQFLRRSWNKKTGVTDYSVIGLNFTYQLTTHIRSWVTSPSQYSGINTDNSQNWKHKSCIYHSRHRDGPEVNPAGFSLFLVGREHPTSSSQRERERDGELLPQCNLQSILLFGAAAFLYELTCNCFFVTAVFSEVYNIYEHQEEITDTCPSLPCVAQMGMREEEVTRSREEQPLGNVPSRGEDSTRQTCICSSARCRRFCFDFSSTHFLLCCFLPVMPPRVLISLHHPLYFSLSLLSLSLSLAHLSFSHSS